MRAGFLHFLKNRNGMRYLDMPMLGRQTQVPFLEKTPRNALNIPFMLELFPDAKFIFLYREPRQNTASIIEAWNKGLVSGQFVTFRNLPQWDRPAWCLLLPPGWRKLKGKSVAEIAAFQWRESNRIIMQDLAQLPQERITCISYQSLVENTDAELGRLCDFSGVDYIPPASEGSGTERLSSTTLTPPHPDKWKKHEQEMRPLLAGMDKIHEEIKAFCRHRA
jgi:hypothetical protein